MDSFEFITKYDQYLNEIRLVIKPELYPQLDELAQIDPHDLVTPETWFQNETTAKGYIWKLFIRKVKAAEMKD